MHFFIVKNQFLKPLFRKLITENWNSNWTSTRASKSISKNYDTRCQAFQTWLLLNLFENFWQPGVHNAPIFYFLFFFFVNFFWLEIIFRVLPIYLKKEFIWKRFLRGKLGVWIRAFFNIFYQNCGSLRNTVREKSFFFLIEILNNKLPNFYS